MKFNYNDGGRKEAGFKGDTGDCVVRAIAIATNKPYLEIYNALNTIAKQDKSKSNARTGVMRKTYERYLLSIGWTWTPTMLIGQGCKIHLTQDELPNGRLIVSLSKHICAVINGIIHDTHDPSRNGTRCVYGYYSAAG